MYFLYRLTFVHSSEPTMHPVLPPPPSPAPVTSHDPAVPHVPEYEEIQELRKTRRHDDNAGENAGEQHALREDYELTKCPAYAITSTM